MAEKQLHKVYRYRKYYQQVDKHIAVDETGQTPTIPLKKWRPLDGMSRGITFFRDGVAKTYYIHSGERTDNNAATHDGWSNDDVAEYLMKSHANNVSFVLEDVDKKEIEEEERMARELRATQITQLPTEARVTNPSNYSVPGVATVEAIVI